MSILKIVFKVAFTIFMGAMGVWCYISYGKSVEVLGIFILITLFWGGLTTYDIYTNRHKKLCWIPDEYSSVQSIVSTIKTKHNNRLHAPRNILLSLLTHICFAGVLVFLLLIDKGNTTILSRAGNIPLLFYFVYLVYVDRWVYLVLFRKIFKI